MPEHSLSRTTHTLDMVQIDQINDRLTGPRATTVTTADLGLEGNGLTASAPLVKVWWEGSPEFPYIYGDFSAGGARPVHAPLHTAALVELSRLLGLRHHWGV